MSRAEIEARGVPSTEVEARYIQIDPAAIAELKFLFESYEGIGVIRTLDKEKAVLALLVVPDAVPVAEKIIEELGRRITIVDLPAEELESDDWLFREIHLEQNRRTVPAD